MVSDTEEKAASVLPAFSVTVPGSFRSVMIELDSAAMGLTSEIDALLLDPGISVPLNCKNSDGVAVPDPEAAVAVAA